MLGHLGIVTVDGVEAFRKSQMAPFSIRAGPAAVSAGALKRSLPDPGTSGAPRWDTMLGMKRHTLCLVIGGLAFVTAAAWDLRAEDERDDVDRLRRSSYAAHIGAAANAAELHRTEEARRWLADAPHELRGWEWGYLAGATAENVALLEVGAAVTVLVVTDDGRHLVAATEAGEVVVWALPSRRLVRRFEAHGAEIRGLAVSPDGQRVATAGRDKTLRVFSLATGERTAEHVAELESFSRLAWSPEGTTLAAGAWERDAETRRPRGVFLLTDPELAPLERHAFSFFVASLAFSPEGRFLVAGAPDGKVVVHHRRDAVEPQELRITSSFGFPYIEDLTFAPDGTWLAAAVQDGTLRRFTTESWEEKDVSCPESGCGTTSLLAVAVSSDGRRLATGSSDALVRLWPADGGGPSILHGHVGAVRDVAFEPGGGLWSASDDGTVRLWQPQGPSNVLEHDGKSVWGLDFSRDGRRLVTAAEDGKLRLWNVAERRLVRVWQGHNGDAASSVFTADGRQVVSGGNDGKLLLWDAERGEKVALLEEVADGRAAAASLSPDGRLLAAGSSRGTAKVWDLATGQVVLRIGGHDAEIYRLVWSADGRTLVTAGNDGWVQVVRVAPELEGQVLHRFKAHESATHGAALSPDGTRLATASADRTIRLWSFPQGELQAELTGHGERIWDVRWSDDGRRLVSASNDRTARVWDVDTGRALLRLSAPMQVYRVAWSPDRETLAVASMDGGVRLYAGGPASP